MSNEKSRETGPWSIRRCHESPVLVAAHDILTSLTTFHRSNGTNLGSHFQLYDLYLVCYNRGLVALVEGIVKHLYRIVVELIRESGPVEGK